MCSPEPEPALPKPVLVMTGAPAAGKSSLTNALVGVHIAPVGRGETSGRPLRLTHSDTVRVDLVTRNADGDVVVMWKIFEDYDHRSPANVARVAEFVDVLVRRPDANDPTATPFSPNEEVVVHMPARILKSVDLLDLPDFGSEPPHIAAMLRENSNAVVVHVWRTSEQITGPDLKCLVHYLGLTDNANTVRPIFLASNGTDMLEFMSDDDVSDPTLVLTAFLSEQARRYTDMRKNRQLPAGFSFADRVEDCAFFAAVSALDIAGKSASKARLCQLAFKHFCEKLLRFAYDQVQSSVPADTSVATRDDIIPLPDAALPLRQLKSDVEKSITPKEETIIEVTL